MRCWRLCLQSRFGEGDSVDDAQVVVSKRAMAIMSSVGSKQQTSVMRRAAAIAVWLDRRLRAEVESAIVKGLPRENLLLYVDEARYDETPMRLAMRENELIHAPRRTHAHVGGEPPRALVPQRELSKQPANTSPVKLLQSQTNWCMVFVRAGQHVCVLGNTIANLQVLERNTAPLLAEAQARKAAASASWQLFSPCARAATLDKAKANPEAERQLISHRGRAWGALGVGCNVHITATSQNRTMP